MTTPLAIDHGANNDQNIIVQVTYDKGSRMTAMRDPRGNLTQYEYDQLGRRTSLTNPLSQVWQTAYADVGAGESRVTMTYPGLGAGTYDVQRDFDRLGRVKSIDYNDAANTPTVSFDYDPLGNLKSMTENNGTSDIRVTGYQYDKADRLRAVDFDTDGDGNVDETVSYDYDISGRRTRLTMPGSKSVTYNYDEKGRLVSLSDWDDQEATFAYDNVGRHIATVRDNGLRSRYRYDKASRLRALTHDKSFQVLAHFAYEVDGRGNRTRALEALPHPSGGPTTIEHTSAVVDYTGTWAIVGDYHETTDTDAALELAFFGDSNLSLKVGEGPDHGKFDIYLNGGLWRTIDGYAATAAERTIDMPIQGDGPHLLRIVNRTDGNSSSSGSMARFKSLTVDGTYDLHTIEYTYDALARLLTANYQPGMNLNATPTQTYNYGFDLAGNLVNMNGTTRTYNAANQMTDDGTNDLTYDPNGNLIDDGVYSYFWDAANRLLRRDNSRPGQPPIGVSGYSYTYDGKGDRIQKTYHYSSGNEWDITNYTLDVQGGLTKVIEENFDPFFGSSETTSFIHGPRGICSQYDGTDWQYMVQDGLGSVRGLVSDAVSISEIASYDPYGTPDTALTSTPFGFTGEQTEGSGQVYLRARYYTPSMGTFTALDPFEGMQGVPMSLNGYSWVEGNVPNAVDPSGMYSVEDCGRRNLDGLPDDIQIRCDYARRLSGAYPDRGDMEFWFAFSVEQLREAYRTGCIPGYNCTPDFAGPNAPIYDSDANRLPDSATVAELSNINFTQDESMLTYLRLADPCGSFGGVPNTQRWWMTDTTSPNQLDVYEMVALVLYGEFGAIANIDRGVETVAARFVSNCNNSGANCNNRSLLNFLAYYEAWFDLIPDVEGGTRFNGEVVSGGDNPPINSTEPPEYIKQYAINIVNNPLSILNGITTNPQQYPFHNVNYRVDSYQYRALEARWNRQQQASSTGPCGVYYKDTNIPNFFILTPQQFGTLNTSVAFVNGTVSEQACSNDPNE